MVPEGLVLGINCQAKYLSQNKKGAICFCSMVFWQFLFSANNKIEDSPKDVYKDDQQHPDKFVIAFKLIGKDINQSQ